MSFSCGFVGLPNSGKSTIFNALTSLAVPCQPYPFCTIDPNVGVVPVPDRRLFRLAELLQPEKVVETASQFVDFAGLIKDARKGEGLGNRFLAHIRNVDAIAHVIRAFTAGQVPHVYEDIDPARDMDIVETEIIISDLEIVEDRIRKIERLAKISKDKGEMEMELLLRIKRFLDAGRFVTMGDFDETEQGIIRGFDLITTKPLFYIANVDEDALADVPMQKVEEAAGKRGREVVYISGKLEQDLSALPEDERTSYMELYGMTEFSIEKIIHVGYRILNLITFYTVVGKVMRAWTISRGTPCVKAAGKIHTDMEKGFIRAEVINIDDFIACGSEHAAREKGLLRLEGKEYIVQ
ncbi:MAG: redox-regulated ATPase YchF, partial [Deltaproteobacteria bacterium]|nr:redox-regulated ATPase YchF [Deltaproteobacteria bacterium]